MQLVCFQSSKSEIHEIVILALQATENISAAESEVCKRSSQLSEQKK